MVDLNTLIPPNSSLYLNVALNINDHREIAVSGTDANGNTHAGLLIPCDENHPGVEGCDYSMVDASKAVEAGNIRVPVSGQDRFRGSMLRRNRFGASARK